MPRIGVGSMIAYDGDLCQIIDLSGSAVVLVDTRGSARRVRLVDLLLPADEGGLAQLSRDAHDEAAAHATTLDGVLWVTASKKAREKAQRIAADVRELSTGYRSGTPAIAEAGEPRTEYDVLLTKIGTRKRAKALERGVSLRLVDEWCQRYRKYGEPGLLDGRSMKSGTLLQNLDPDWLDTCTSVLADLSDQAKVRKLVVLGWIEDRVRQRTLRGDYGDREVRRPSPTTANKVLDELARGKGLFQGSTKTKRSVNGRPAPPYGRLIASRPGEYLLLDTTRLNVFALDTMTGKWDSVEMTSALDLYDRTIKGLRLSPRSSKSIDVASVLLESMQPFDRPSSWRSDAEWPYSGIPDSILIDTDRIRVERFWTAADADKRKRQQAERLAHGQDHRPASTTADGVLPETIVVDHGKVYMSEHTTNLCARLGISIQPARIAMGSDKGAKERFFGTIEQLLQELPGYKGRSVDTRGKDPENEVVYTIQQLEQIVREWIATVYHHTPHSSLADPHLPGVLMTPIQAYDRGIAVAGRLRLPLDRNLLLEMLPIKMRHFNHYGVDIEGLKYTGDIVSKYQNRSRVITTKQRDWAFHYNPDDLRYIYFNDPDDGKWHILKWIRIDELDMPFSMDALEHAKRNALTRGGKKDVEGSLVALLTRLGIARGDTPREKLIAARLTAQQQDSALRLDQPTSLSTVRKLMEAHHASTGSTALVLPADEEPPITLHEDHPKNADLASEGFYDDVLDDL